MLLSFIKYHVKSTLLICFVYGLLFFFQLVLTGEAICENGFDHSRIEDTTYTYVLSGFEYDKIDKLITEKTLNYSDICIISHNGLYDFVSYPQGVDERRLGYRKIGTPTEYGIICLSDGISSESLFRAEIVDGQLVHLLPRDADIECNVYEVENKIYIENKEYRKGQYISIKNTYTEELPPSQLYCSFQTFKDIAPQGIIMVSLSYKKPLGKVELDNLNEKMRTVCNAEYKARQGVVDNDSRNLASDIGFVAIMIIIAALCFSSLMLSTLSERNNEYRILHFCGATYSKIETERIKHVSFILLSSICIGSIFFLIIRACVKGFIDYKNDDMFYYIGNVLGFVAITAITGFASRKVNWRRKYVYSDKQCI